MHDIIKKIRRTLNWIKFKKYYKTWLCWFQYCDHFVEDKRRGYDSSYNFKCPERKGKSEGEEHLLPSHKDIEGYLDKFTSGKMCLI